MLSDGSGSNPNFGSGQKSSVKILFRLAVEAVAL